MGEFLVELALEAFGELAEAGVTEFLHKSKVKRGVKTLLMSLLALIPVGFLGAVAAICGLNGDAALAWSMGLFAAALAIVFSISILRGHRRNWKPKPPKAPKTAKCKNERKRYEP